MSAFISKSISSAEAAANRVLELERQIKALTEGQSITLSSTLDSFTELDPAQIFSKEKNPILADSSQGDTNIEIKGTAKLSPQSGDKATEILQPEISQQEAQP